MSTIELAHAKSILASLVRRAADGETIVIEEEGRAQAKLVGLGGQINQPVAGRRGLGMLRGRITAPDDFDAPLPDDVVDCFEGH